MDVEYPDSNLRFPGVAFDGSGAGFGIHAGHDRDFGTFVLGAEVSADFPSVDVKQTSNGAPAPREIDYFAVVKPKAGYDAGRFLPYGVIGYARQDFNSTNAVVANQSFDGMTHGLGVTCRVGPNLIAGVEALWFDIDPTNTSSLTSEGTMLSLRLSCKFRGFAAPATVRT